MYEVLLEGNAQRDLKKLPIEIFHRLTSEIGELANNPRPRGCRKIVGSQSDWRIRIGQYRIIYEIDDPARIIRVMRVRHRKEVYR